MMHIPVINQLETREEWVRFLRRERSYAYISAPLCLIDLQTTYLQITLLDETMLDGRQAIKYSLGSSETLEPAWQLIKGCEWRLSRIITGLETLDFNTNARDNDFANQLSALSVRKFYAKDKRLLAPSLIGGLAPLTKPPEQWSITAAIALLSNEQFEQPHYLARPDKRAPTEQLLLQMLDSPEGWDITTNGETITLLYHQSPVFSCRIKLDNYTPRLKR